MAAATGLDVIPKADATVEPASGRSGRILLANETSLITGMIEKKVLLVPVRMQSRYDTYGATKLIALGRARSALLAIWTMYSMPPAACIAAAAEMTAMMISIASNGGSPGSSPKKKTR